MLYYYVLKARCVETSGHTTGGLKIRFLCTCVESRLNHGIYCRLVGTNFELDDLDIETCSPHIMLFISS